MKDKPLPNSEFILYQTEDGRTRIQCRFENETIWLTQALIGELFEKDVRTINEHLVNIFDEGELSREATIRKFRIVRQEGARQAAREVDHDNLDASSPSVFASAAIVVGGGAGNDLPNAGSGDRALPHRRCPPHSHRHQISFRPHLRARPKET